MENPRGVSSSLPGHMCTVVLLIIINFSIKSPFSYREDSSYLIITMTIYKNIARGAPQDGNPNQAQASVTDTGSGFGTPASERAQVKVAGVHWFSCTPSSIAKTWVRTLIVLILTVALIGLLLILANKLGLIKLK